jgi:hypothetical protein
MKKCSLFQNDSTLLVSPYRVQSPVSLSIFREFLSALDGKAIKITDTNYTELERLCNEFGFSELGAKLSEFRPSIDFKETEDADARGRIAVLEEESNQHSHDIAMLQDKVTQLSTDFERLVGEVSVLRSTAVIIDELSEAFSPAEMERSQKKFEQEMEEFQANIMEMFESPSTAARSPAALRRNSRIFSDFPEIFTEFRGKCFKMLWRGGRDGFGSKEFHGRCDGHANTLTVILDTEGNIFGGFTPLEWDSEICLKGDDTETTFIFTLKNPHKIPSRKFTSKTEAKHEAISCSPIWGPNFGDIAVSDNCNANTEKFGSKYTNDTGLDGEVLLTGSGHFQVKEIEVFEITD